MDEPGEFDQSNAAEDDLDEADLTEEEFDTRMAAGEPVLVIGFAARARLRERVENYYTLQVSDTSTVRTSAGRWGGSAPSVDDRYGQVVSRV